MSKYVKTVFHKLFDSDDIEVLAKQWATVKHIPAGKSMQNLANHIGTFNKTKAREDMAKKLTINDLIKATAVPTLQQMCLNDASISFTIRSRIELIDYLELNKHKLVKDCNVYLNGILIEIRKTSKKMQA